MAGNQPSRFEVLRGVIADLVVSSGEEEFVQTAADKAVGASLGATLTLSGLAGAATGSMLATSGSSDAVQFFTCMVNGKRVAGRFSKVWFENGDAVEVVGQVQRDGTFAAYAVRRTSDRTLWLFPHCSRGSRAHWTYAWKMVPVVCLLLMVFLAGFFGWADSRASSSVFGDDFDIGAQLLVGLLALNAVALGFYFPLKIAYKWRPFVHTAEGVFSALGYADPQRVDMEKQNKLYWKKHAKPGEERRVAPWVFRYVDER